MASLIVSQSPFILELDSSLGHTKPRAHRTFLADMRHVIHTETPTQTPQKSIVTSTLVPIPGNPSAESPLP
jgi:hypothetical protein